MDGNNLRVLTEQSFVSSSVLSVSWLSLTNCRLQAVSGLTFSRLTRLSSLNLSNNNISSLDHQEDHRAKQSINFPCLSFFSIDKTRSPLR